METALRGEISQLKQKIREKDIERATMECTLRRRICKLEEELQETDSLKKEAESAFRDQRRYYEKKQEETDAAREQVEVALNDIADKLNKKLEEKVRESRKTKALFDRIIADQRKILAETRLKKERAIRQIMGLEKEVRKKDRDTKTVLASLRREIDELLEKLGKTNMDK
jgi:hypothetical protein